MNKKMAEAIAAWWTRFLRTGERNEAHLADFEAQSPRPGLLTTLLKSNKIDVTRADTFEKELTRLLLEGPDKKTHRYGIANYPEHFELSVDYDPQNFLARAAELAGLPSGPCTGLPYKTWMLVTMDVAVAHMRGNPEQVVYGEKPSGD